MLKEEEEKHFKVRKFEIGEDTPYMVPVMHTHNVVASLYTLDDHRELQML